MDPSPPAHTPLHHTHLWRTSAASIRGMATSPKNGYEQQYLAFIVAPSGGHKEELRGGALWWQLFEAIMLI